MMGLHLMEYPKSIHAKTIHNTTRRGPQVLFFSGLVDYLLHLLHVSSIPIMAQPLKARSFSTTPPPQPATIN